MDIFLLGFLEFVVSFIAPYIWTRNPQFSLKVAATNVVLMLFLAKLMGVV